SARYVSPGFSNGHGVDIATEYRYACVDGSGGSVFFTSCPIPQTAWFVGRWMKTDSVPSATTTRSPLSLSVTATVSSLHSALHFASAGWNLAGAPGQQPNSQPKVTRTHIPLIGLDLSPAIIHVDRMSIPGPLDRRAFRRTNSKGERTMSTLTL